jgi:SAM-dependent methyltransferase
VATANEWWKDFITGPWLDVQRRIWTPEDTARDADRVERLLGCDPGAPILDVPCGEGRVTVELAVRGYRMTGLDLTAPLIADGRDEARRRAVDVRLVQADMRAMPLSGAFDAAFCLWGSFGYFDHEGDRGFARGVATALRPGGRFLLETLVAESLLPTFQKRGWTRLGDLVVLEERTWDHERGRIETEWTFAGVGMEPSTDTSSIRVYTYRELRSLLAEAGFDAFEGFDHRTGEPFGLGASRLALVATKAA